MKTLRLVPLALLAACAGPSTNTSDPIQAALERVAARGEEAQELHQLVSPGYALCLDAETIVCLVSTAPSINGEVERVDGQAIAIATDLVWLPPEGGHVTFELYRGTFYKGRAIALEVVEGHYICHVVDLKAGAVVSPGDNAATNL